jgi:hypothetical protein
VNAPASHPADALLSFVYGELPAEEARSVQAHLDGCAECAATLAGYRAVREAARALPRELPAAARVEPLLQAAQAAAARARRRRRAVWTGCFAAGAAAAALALFALRPTQAPESPAAMASAPAAAPVPPGALALNTAPRAEERGAVREAEDVTRPAAVAAKTTRAKAAPAQPEALTRRDVAALAEAPAKEAKKAELSPPQAPAPASASVHPSAAARMAAGGASAPATAGAVAGASADAATSPEAVAQRTRDEARRQALLLRLKDASPAQALPLLSELCTLQERLGHPGEARAACTRVVEGYPGTPEATAARAALQRLGPGPLPP